MYTTTETMSLFIPDMVETEEKIKQETNYTLAQVQKLIAELSFVDHAFSIIGRLLLRHPFLDDIIDLKIQQVDRERSGISYNNGATFVTYPFAFIEEVCNYLFDSQILREGSDNIFITPQGNPMYRPLMSRTIKNAAERSGLLETPPPRDFRRMWIDIWMELSEGNSPVGLQLCDKIYDLLGKNNPFLRKLSPSYTPLKGVDSDTNEEMKKVYMGMNRVGDKLRSVYLHSLVPDWLDFQTDLNCVKYYPGYFDEFLDIGGIVNKDRNAASYTVQEFAELDWKSIEKFILSYPLWRGNGPSREKARLYCFKNLRHFLDHISHGWFIRVSKCKE